VTTAVRYTTEWDMIPANAGIQLVYARSWMPAFAGMTALGGGALSCANGQGTTPNRPSFRRTPESSLFASKAGYTNPALQPFMRCLAGVTQPLGEGKSIVARGFIISHHKN